MLDLDLKVKLFKEYLENGGMESIPFIELLDSIMEVKIDTNGKVIPETVNSHIRAAMNAYVATQLMEPFTSPIYMSEYESFLQKSIFFQQRNIEKREELDAFIVDYGNKKNLIYRGVREARWRLYSSLQRHWIIQKYADKKVDHKAFIIDLLKNSRSMFRETLPSFLAKNNIDPGNDMAILSFIQHHGQPTPLLDWTEDLASALYFATEGIDLTLGTREVHQYFSVYILDGDLFSRYGIKEHMEKKIKSYTPEFRKGLEKYAEHNGIPADTYDKLFPDRIMKMMTIMKIGNKFASGLTSIELLYNLPFVFFSDSIDDMLKFGLNNNLRITNQRGVFTWNSDPTLPLEHVILNATKKGAKNDTDLWVCGCININKNLAADVREFLNQNGIDKDYIYPDPELLARQSFIATLRNKSLNK